MAFLCSRRKACQTEGQAVICQAMTLCCLQGFQEVQLSTRSRPHPGQP